MPKPGRYKRVSLDDVKMRVAAAHGTTVTLDESTFVNVMTKARFVDVEHGEWWTLPRNVYLGKSHPLRGNQKIADSKRYSIEYIVSEIKRVHGDVVVLDTSTYIESQTKARFVDKDHGEWWTWLKHVLDGKRHPSVQREASTIHRRLPITHIRATIHAHHGDIVTMDEASYTGSISRRARFIDCEYGEWNAIVYHVMGGKGHPLRKHKKAASTRSIFTPVTHWKTGVECYAASGFEYCVLQWLNAKRYDFDWQIPIKTPILTPIKHQPAIYWIDLLIKSGPFANAYVEIKGFWWQNDSGQSVCKWQWFHETHANSELWMKGRLRELGILPPSKVYDRMIRGLQLSAKMAKALLSPEPT